MFAVVTPVKNEGKRLLDTADQLMAQTQVPDFWIIVNDNSSDDTPKIIKQLEKDYDFITDVSLKKTSPYDEVARYGHVVRVGFEHALESCRAVRFLGILDADIKLGKNYYKALINCMGSFPRLGIASGLYFELKNKLRLTSGAYQNFSICGGAMVFRKECLLDIGGFPTCPSPDTVALLKAANRGWKIGVISSTYALHLRPNRSLAKYIRLGQANYSLNYNPVNAILSGPILALRNFSLSPLGLTIGYIISIVKGHKITDNETNQYFHNSFIRRSYTLINTIFLGKKVNLDPIERALVTL